eukprot:GFYU01010495.1.p1 GENE.GFYU01010495.1~~GFYU01010495.1.p1  ORF type:complete len:299 (+),score=80.38 GFYU01010495.1:57-899(+)
MDKAGNLLEDVLSPPRTPNPMDNAKKPRRPSPLRVASIDFSSINESKQKLLDILDQNLPCLLSVVEANPLEISVFRAALDVLSSICYITSKRYVGAILESILKRMKQESIPNLDTKRWENDVQVLQYVSNDIKSDDAPKDQELSESTDDEDEESDWDDWDSEEECDNMDILAKEFGRFLALITTSLGVADRERSDSKSGESSQLMRARSFSDRSAEAKPPVVEVFVLEKLVAELPDGDQKIIRWINDQYTAEMSDASSEMTTTDVDLEDEEESEFDPKTV